MPHPTADQIEAYAIRSFHNPGLLSDGNVDTATEQIQEHFLWCGACLDQVQANELYVSTLAEAVSVFNARAAQPRTRKQKLKTLTAGENFFTF